MVFFIVSLFCCFVCIICVRCVFVIFWCRCLSLSFCVVGVFWVLVFLIMIIWIWIRWVCIVRWIVVMVFMGVLLVCLLCWVRSFLMVFVFFFWLCCCLLFICCWCWFWCFVIFVLFVCSVIVVLFWMIGGFVVFLRIVFWRGLLIVISRVRLWFLSVSFVRRCLRRLLLCVNSVMFFIVICVVCVVICFGGFWLSIVWCCWFRVVWVGGWVCVRFLFVWIMSWRIIVCIVCSVRCLCVISVWRRVSILIMRLRFWGLCGSCIRWVYGNLFVFCVFSFGCCGVGFVFVCSVF